MCVRPPKWAWLTGIFDPRIFFPREADPQIFFSSALYGTWPFLFVFARVLHHVAIEAIL